MRVRFTLTIGYPTAKHVEIVEFVDGTKDSEIEQEYQDWCNNYIDGGWAILKDGQEDDE